RGCGQPSLSGLSDCSRGRSGRRSARRQRYTEMAPGVHLSAPASSPLTRAASLASQQSRGPRVPQGRTQMKRLHRRVIAVSAIGIALAATCVGTVLAAPGMPDDNVWPYAQAAPHAAVLAAVGDIACEPDDSENAATPAKLKCGSPTLGGTDAQFATADQIEGMHPDLVALLGDEQYEVGKLTDFEGSFDKSYRAFKF